MKIIYESGFLGDFDVEKLYYEVRTVYRGTKLYQNSRPNTNKMNRFDTIVSAFFLWNKGVKLPIRKIRVVL